MKTLKPIQITASHESLQDYLLRIIKTQVYLPLVQSIGKSVRILNTSRDLTSAIIGGSINYTGSKFVGQFSAEISKELKELGATWDKGWVLSTDRLPMELVVAIAQGKQRNVEKLTNLLSTINKIDPDKIEVDPEHLFHKGIEHTDKSFEANTQTLEITPDVSPAKLHVMKTEYIDNVKRSIKDLTIEQISKLRETIQTQLLAGNRSKTLEKPIEDYLKATLKESYGVSVSKIQFIARQETKLAMSTYAYDRYKAAGVTEYKWHCVTGSPNHPVRPYHKVLDGTIQKFDEPPVTSPKGDRNNPQEDFNCRCVAIPIVPQGLHK